MVMRYKFNDVVSPGMYPERDGNYVKYEDYVELERKLRNFADQVLYAPCSKVTEEMACEILDL